ncbi:MAG: 3'-5' exonuclease [Paludibacteraceae bacterium]
MKNFAAIDFETANGHPTSICSVGVVIVREGKVTEKFYSLIKPEPDFYNYWNTQVHGIRQEDTMHQSVFPRVWEQIEPLITDLPFVAHNKRFDENCLKAVFRMYRMDYPDYDFFCTLQMARSAFKGILPNFKLDTVSRHCGFDLTRHHHALADAEACARIALTIGLGA